MTIGATARAKTDIAERRPHPPLSLASAPAPEDVLTDDSLDRPLSEVDPEVAEVLALELERQQRTLEMIASENFVPMAVLECQGSVLTNKYAVGYPERREYGGCEHVDVAERLAVDRACELFGAEHANVQPYSGAMANTAVYHALLDPRDTILRLEVAHGGHLTHGTPIHVSGRLYDTASYRVDRQTGLIDMDAVSRIARERGPQLILAGWSAYPRFLDFERFRAIADEVGAYLVVDMAHFAGLVAAGLYPNPVPYADAVTTTIHKTLGGPRGGMILCTEELAKRIDAAVYPGQQGGPLQHVIAGKAVALRIAGSDAFRERQQRTVAGARAVAAELLSAGGGLDVLTGGTDVHLVMCDLRKSPLNGREAEDRLAAVGIMVSRSAVPFDPRPPAVTSGLRIGSAALATRGLQVDDFAQVGALIAEALQPDGFDQRQAELAKRASAIVERFPLYGRIGPAALV
jgi:glycine hydroxymethyltransferase